MSKRTGGKNTSHIPFPRLFKLSVIIIQLVLQRESQEQTFISALIIFLSLSYSSYQFLLYIKINEKLKDMLCDEESYCAFQWDQGKSANNSYKIKALLWMF